ncbi:MAG: 4Fe-4S dicluster domain-containing protein [Sediminispirochaetaceae bacterium]
MSRIRIILSFSIQHDPAACTDCGLCDKACYIASLNGEYSHFRHGKKRPGSAYSCSRCLACVNSCPKGSLTYSLDV